MSTEIQERFARNTRPAPLPDVPGIYFLCKRARIVYVGKATDIAKRVATHEIKDFDSVLIMRVPEDLLTKVECYWIDKLRPPFNRIPGRPPTGKIRVLLKLSAEANKLLSQAAAKEGITKSEFAERAFWERVERLKGGAR
jgi:excinuclease UvrABC nuclease subunit